MATKSITGERPNLDRIAGPWLIRRTIGPDADLLHVPAEQALAVPAETDATSYEIPGAYAAALGVTAVTRLRALALQRRWSGIPEALRPGAPSSRL